jgi:hypothetical protein
MFGVSECLPEATSFINAHTRALTVEDVWHAKLAHHPTIRLDDRDLSCRSTWATTSLGTLATDI